MKMKISVSNLTVSNLFKNILFYGFAFCLILSCISVYYQYNGDQVMLYTGVFASLSLLYVINGTSKRKFSRAFLTLCIYLAIAILVDLLVKETSQYYYRRFYFYVPIFIMLVCLWDYEEKMNFLNILERVIYFFTISSLILWLLGPIMKIIPTTGSYEIIWGRVRTYYSYFGLLFQERIQIKTFFGIDYSRNLSIFPEGPFSNLMFSMGLVLYLLTKERISMFKVIVYALSIFTSFSTTGWGMMVVIFGVSYIRSENKKNIQNHFNRNLIKYVIPTVVVMAGAYVIYSVISFKESTDNVNYLSHTIAFANGFRVFLSHPLSGVGIGQSAQYSISSSGFFNSTSGFFRILGDGGIILTLLYMLPMIVIFYKSQFGKKNFKLTSLYVFLIIMLVTVIWQYSLLLLFFVAFAYSFLLNEVPSEGKSPSNSSSDNSSVGIGVSSKKIAGGYYGA